MKILLVLDSIRYKSKESSLKEIFCNYDIDFLYTDYENRLIKYFHSIRLAGDFMSHLAYWILSFSYALKILSLRKKNYTHIIFINPIVGFFYCLFSRPDRKNLRIYLCGLLFVEKKSAVYYNLRKILLGYALRRVDRLFVYSEEEIRIYTKEFPMMADRIKFIRYGRDFDIFRENEYSSGVKYIASGGISNRDYETLMDSIRILNFTYPDLVCKVATRPGTFRDISSSGNIELLYDIRIDQFGSFIENSEFVVLPLKETALSAGHMTLFEAMSLGKIIIIADIPAVRDYVDENLVYFYKPSSINDLANKIEYVHRNIGESPEIDGRGLLCMEKYRSDYTFSSFLKRILTDLNQTELI